MKIIKRKIILSFTLSSLILSSNLFGANSSLLTYLTVYNDKLYFSASDGTNGFELWVSDGSDSGTKMLKDINSGSNNSSPKNFVTCNGKLYFSAKDGTHGEELWVTDGTEAGTQILKDINSGSGYSNINYAVELNGKFYFQANDGSHGAELWVSDGTEADTQMVKDIYSGSTPSSPSYLIGFNGKLYFNATDGINGEELWESNGSADGTKILKDINSGSGASSPKNFAIFNGKLYFNANDGTHGEELWESNGSADGTKMLKDIYSGMAYNSSSPEYLTVFNNKLYFSASDDINGTELWESNGSVDGTNIFTDLRLGDGMMGPNSSLPKYLTVFNNKLYFSAFTDANGYELWESDGSSNGTKMLKDIYSGSDSSDPQYFTVVNNKLYFRATNEAKGTELWVYDGVNEPKIFKDINFDNTIPTVTNVAINGTIDIGETLIGSYLLNDDDVQSEDNSTYKWYRANDTNGTNAEAINGATNKTYTIAIADSGKYLIFEVSPYDGIDKGSEVNSSYSSQIPIKVDFSSVITTNKWNMISVPDEINVSTSNLSGAIIWTFNNSTNQWEQPTKLIAGKGYMLYTSSTINSVSATATSSTITDDNTTIKSINNETWTLVGISKNTNGFSWNEIHNPNNTLKNGCDYIQVFYYDSANSTWNTSINIPYLGAVWVKQNCLND